MTRVTNAPASRERRKAVLDQVKGYWGRSSSCFRLAKKQLWRSMCYQYAHRRLKKRDMRTKLFIPRINAWARSIGETYSSVMHSLKETQINRKMLADLVCTSPEVATEILRQARAKTS